MFTGKLHPYQVEGVERIIAERTLLVAYSMGTGKTVLTIAALEHLFGEGEINRALILVPASLKWQWAQSMAAFTDMPTRAVRIKTSELVVPAEEVCTVINGTRAQRAAQWELSRDADVVIASYGAVLHDWDHVRATPADILVLDEATAIKNFAAQTTKRIKSLMPDTRVALTGNPVENGPPEVFSIMEWVDPHVLGRWDLFDKSFIVRNHFGAVKGYKNLDLLHRNLAKAMIRKSRLDPDVAKYLPAVSEAVHLVQLDQTTRAIYMSILTDLQEALEELAEQGETLDIAAYYAGQKEGGTGFAAQGKVMARLMAGRLLLDHPQLLMDSAVAFHEDGGEGSAYAAEFAGSRIDLPDHHHSPKLDALEHLVSVIDGEGARVVVFTEYRKMLPYISARLGQRLGLAEFHGQLSSDAKAAAIAKFKTDPDCRVLLCTNAGGYGLDLPEAQYVINYDLPYSNGVLAQRNTRHVRASSTFDRVHVVNLVVADTLEERVLTTLRLRQKLADAVVDGRGSPLLDVDLPSISEVISSTS